MIVDAHMYLACVCSEEPDLELQAVLKRFPREVYFFQGSVMNPDSLDRVLVREADAVRDLWSNDRFSNKYLCF